MSVFTDGTDTNVPPAPPVDDSNRDYSAELVAAKGEQWNEMAVVAKGYLAAQAHIDNQQTQIDEMKETLGKNDYMKEILARLDAQPSPPPSGDVPPSDIGSTDADSPPTTASVEQIKELVEKTITDREVSNTASRNLAETDAKLTEMFGTEADNVVIAKGRQLGMSKERLKELAAESPNAFFTLIGEASTKETNRTLGDSSMNPDHTNLHRASERDWNYYMKLRKDNPKLYRTGKVQMQMHADRERLGAEKFG